MPPRLYVRVVFKREKKFVLFFLCLFTFWIQLKDVCLRTARRVLLWVKNKKKKKWQRTIKLREQGIKKGTKLVEVLSLLSCT